MKELIPFINLGKKCTNNHHTERKQRKNKQFELYVHFKTNYNRRDNRLVSNSITKPTLKRTKPAEDVNQPTYRQDEQPEQSDDIPIWKNRLWHILYAIIEAIITACVTKLLDSLLFT